MNACFLFESNGQIAQNEAKNNKRIQIHDKTGRYTTATVIAIPDSESLKISFQFIKYRPFNGYVYINSVKYVATCP
jgi:hypothetical protein